MARTAAQSEYQADVKRLLRRAARVTDNEWHFGRLYYPTEGAWLRDVAADRNVCPVKTIYSFAALSPRTQYGRNVQGLYDLLDGKPIHGCLPTQVEKARRIWTDDRLDHIQGPKERPFAEALCGDEDALVVDVWMMRCFFGMDSHDAPRTKGERARIEKAFRGAARRSGHSVCTFQAAMWFNIRGHKPTDPDWISQLVDDCSI